MSVRYLGRALRHPHRRRRPHRRAPHQRDRAERVRLRRAPLGALLDARRVPRSSAARRCRSRQGNVAGARRSGRRAGFAAARLPLLLPAGALPPAADASPTRRWRRPPTGYGRLLRRAAPSCARRPASAATPSARSTPLRARFRAAVRDDLNAPRALAVAWEVARERRARAGGAPRAAARVRRAARPRPRDAEVPRASARESDPRIDALVAEREAARAAPRLRARPTASATQLAAEGIAIEDTPRAEPTLAARASRERERFELVSEFKPPGRPAARDRGARATASRAATRTRRCSASPAAASPSRWPAWSSR